MGHQIRTIQCDTQFATLLDVVNNGMNILMDYTAAGEHESVAERNIRTIKERIRAAIHSMPYKIIPKTMIKELCPHMAELINIFPAKGGISKELSPYTIMHKKAVNYPTELKYPFGSYVQANHESKRYNTEAPRTLDCIYLGPMRNKSDGHKVLHLSSNKVILRNTIRVVPVTQDVIKQVEARAKRDGIKGFKFQMRDGSLLENGIWLAGVDTEAPVNENTNAANEEDE